MINYISVRMINNTTVIFDKLPMNKTDVNTIVKTHTAN